MEKKLLFAVHCLVYRHDGLSCRFSGMAEGCVVVFGGHTQHCTTSLKTAETRSDGPKFGKSLGTLRGGGWLVLLSGDITEVGG